MIEKDREFMAEFNPLSQLEQLLGAAGAERPAIFPPNSRYEAIGTTTFVDENGDEIVHLERRFVPQPELFATSREYLVVQDDRIDRISNLLLGDPLLYWRLCDANRALAPEELEIVGRRLRAILAEGIAPPEDDQ